eukprot:TRINITY_DN5402_c0_g2_i2.p1 TRINITY_DN5402_c0_g2~~TRINITY_DN5402_c0_g2_i2.p1  ORF type:complete len:501 (+),score=140.55 TRINITY_DN5402_c0_g2_i2:216-1718(+)
MAEVSGKQEDAKLSDKLLFPSALTDSQLPILQQPHEIACHVCDDVSVEFEDMASGEVLEWATLRHGTAHLTTHRVIWVDESFNINRKKHECRAYSLVLASVKDAGMVKKNVMSSAFSMFASPRLRFRVEVVLPDGRVQLPPQLLPPPPSAPSPSPSAASDGALAPQQQPTQKIAPNLKTSMASVVLVFRGKSPHEPFVKKAMDALKSRAWEAALKASVHLNSGHGGLLPSPSSGSSPTFNPAMAGVGGILRREQEQIQATDKDMQEAFSDLNALMVKAKDMVVLAERMRAKLLAPSSSLSADSLPSSSLSSSVSSIDGELEGSQQEMQDWLLRVGIMSPVTKESAGALYHQQLARQLADFVAVPVQRAGGMMSLVDVYCHFNRARGTELISPEDLLQACRIWDTMNVGLMLRQFDSGVIVIQSKSRSDEQMLMRIKQMVRSRAEGKRVGVTAMDAANELGISPALAKEQLLLAERRGLVCRDDAADGLRFFANHFLGLNE